MNKTTAVAPSNVAFIKYWGRKDEELRLPSNGSISMNLSNLLTTTTVEFDDTLSEDIVTINDVTEKDERVSKHLDRVRLLASITTCAKVVSKNNFPASTGLSSSASGFAALSLAASRAAGLTLSEKELSILARQGSGSACRSIPDGFVEWLDGDTSDESYSVSIFPEDHWNIKDVVVVVSSEKKNVPTSEGMKTANTSYLFKKRLEHMKEKIEKCKTLMKEKNFVDFGELIEKEALELHSIFMTSKPSLMYLLPETAALMKMVKDWRNEGMRVYFTVNTGQNIHLIIEEETENALREKLSNIPFIQEIITNVPSKGAHTVEDHLF